LAEKIKARRQICQKPGFWQILPNPLQGLYLCETQKTDILASVFYIQAFFQSLLAADRAAA
jgi:hypothetical protein